MQELFPGRFSPTPTHYFLRLLHEKGLLLRCYTQNIDSLETLAGVPPEKVIAAHGNFDSATCISCEAQAELDHVKECALAGKVRTMLEFGTTALHCNCPHDVMLVQSSCL